MRNYIETLDYGFLEIRYNKDYLEDNVIDYIELCGGDIYEVRRNTKGKLVAIRSEE